MDVDVCSGDVAEYLEAGELRHSEEKCENTPSSIYHQIKRIELPKFKGDKKEYFSWKAAFKACIDSSHIAEEVKLVHL